MLKSVDPRPCLKDKKVLASLTEVWPDQWLRIFPIRTMSFQKAGSFSKMESLSTTWFSWFAESTSEPTGIRTRKLGKTILIVEISPSALLLEATVSCTELRITQGQSCWKEDSACFPWTPSSTRSKHRKTLDFQPKKGWSKWLKWEEN